MRTVMLHALWRSGSTWMFSKFRQNPSYLCFYEPLHELLARPQPWINGNPTQGRNYGHPDLSKPYFAEFEHAQTMLPLYTQRYAATEYHHLSEACIHYIQGLIQVSEQHQRTAFLQFNRSAGRLHDFVQHFPSVDHIYLYRHPRSQFESLKTREPRYFLPLTIAHALRSPNFVHKLRSLGCATPTPWWLALQLRLASSVDSLRAVGRRIQRSWPEDMVYEVFLAWWKFTLDQAQQTGMRCIEVDALSTDKQIQQAWSIDYGLTFGADEGHPARMPSGSWHEAIEHKILGTH